MLAYEEHRNVASVIKTHGRKGEVVVAATDGLPSLLEEGMEVALVPPALKGPRHLAITGCVGDGRTRLVSFAGVDDLCAASKLVGRSVLVRVRDLPEDLALHDAYAVMGREVTDVRLGSLGVVSEVMQGPANDVWVVEGPFGEVLVPAVAQIVLDATGEGPILVNVPQGLVGEEVSA